MENGIIIHVSSDPATGMPKQLEITGTRARLGAPKIMKQFAQRMRGNVHRAPGKHGYPAGSWKKSRRALLEGGETLADTKRLIRSFVFNSDAWGIDYGTSDKRARILFLGGTIRPKHASALTIPISKEARKKSAKDFDDLFVYESKWILGKKKKYLAEEDGDKLKVHYLLVPSVTMPERKPPTPIERDYKYLDGKLLDHFGGEPNV